MIILTLQRQDVMASQRRENAGLKTRARDEEASQIPPKCKNEATCPH